MEIMPDHTKLHTTRYCRKHIFVYLCILGKEVFQLRKNSKTKPLIILS